MEKIIEILHNGNYTLVIANCDDIRCFTNRGVVDIYTTLANDSQFLRGAFIADKVIGRAAAAIMILGGVDRVYTDTISEGAIELFNKNNIKIDYVKVVPHIINRDGSNWCPLELICKELTDVEEMRLAVGSFLIRNKILVS